VLGAKANTRRGEIFMARQITSGGKTIILRDEKGNAELAARHVPVKTESKTGMALEAFPF
jgi:hypothetical protein